MADNDMVEPGQPLAFSEELLPGDGTYDDGTQIRAAVWGRTHIDPQTHEVTVTPAGKAVAQVEVGDIIVGEITYIKPELASVRVLEVRGKPGRSLLHQVEATLHVSKIDNRYIKELGTEYHCGDLIRAKVIGLKGGPQLVTDKPDLGCIAAFSRNDPRRRLERRGNKLMDPEDGHFESRKVANDYGSGTV